MVKCARCCLYHSMRALNLVVIFCGIGMIIYSLWLLKRWKDGFLEFDSVPAQPKPWFIYTCLGVGIVVCLSTLCSLMAFNFISLSTLSFYIASVCFILFLQGGLIVAIFYKMDWDAKIAKYVSKEHEQFQNFLIIHFAVCRSIALLVLFVQVNSAILAVVLWAMGPESRNHCGTTESSESPQLTHSFLVRSDPRIDIGSV